MTLILIAFWLAVACGVGAVWVFLELTCAAINAAVEAEDAQEQEWRP